MQERLTKFECKNCDGEISCFLFAECESLPDVCPFGDNTADWK